MKIGLFGGSFNPVHNGHIKIAEYAYKTLELDKIFFIPTASSPFKKDKVVASAEHRVNMLNLALEKFNGNAEVSMFEIKRGGVSYTYETIRYFKQKYPNDELFFIMGSDLVSKFNKWEYADEISQSAKFVVYKRSKNFNKMNAKKYNMLLINNPIFEESSTAVREGVLHFASENVNKYIGCNFLYAKEIIHSVLSAKRAKHCVAAAEFAAELAKTVKYNARDAYYAGLFHDVCKELSEDESRSFIVQFGLNGYNKNIYPKHKLHQTCGALWVKHIYMNNNAEIYNSILVHTTLNNDLGILDKIVFIADKICDGRAFEGVQKLRKLVMSDFDLGFKEVVKRAYEYNIEKGVQFDDEQLKIYKKWMN
ncbi:nicotinate-nucleotide adenylyltransferase [Mycoplasmopsis felifaucium]|uniref:nicotinate-nucleotide adenylyltransferase n=1 Tax=Mycoplasmopsis felifaucium TaxID=35768 RepID=UPI00048A13A9|nr:nicotinate-nucleotide adenylyltransferase [Mycoplasmopsis felifaucium]